jgi:hypothetical protein
MQETAPLVKTIPRPPGKAILSQAPVISAPPQPVTTVGDEGVAIRASAAEESVPPPPPPPSARPSPKPHPTDTKTVGIVRQAAGRRWIDPALAEWPENDYRVFVGNLAPEVTDNMLMQAFSQYGSVQKARVIRNLKTNKSKGYGFISFADAREGASALKEIHGKYIGSRPCQLKRSKDDHFVTDRKGRVQKRSLDRGQLHQAPSEKSKYPRQ